MSNSFQQGGGAVDDQPLSRSRRSILRGLASGTVLLLTNSFIRVCKAGEATMLDPFGAWQALPDAARYPDPRVRAVAYGVLAPNVQNLQPWFVQLVSEHKALVFADLSRRLPVSDPPDRQLTVSFGTFTELMRVGASVDGYRLEIKPFPEGEPGAELDNRPIVEIDFVRDAAVSRDALVDHVLERSTNRRPFDLSRRVDSRLIAKAKAGAIHPGYVGGTVDEQLAGRIRNIAHRAYLIEMAKATTRRELVNVTRVGHAEASSYAWGPAVLGPETEAKIADRTLTRAALDNPESATYKAGLEGYLRAVDTGRAYVWVLTPDNSRRSMFDAGRNWTRLHLSVTAMGLKLQPHSQALHDYPEIEPYKGEMHAAIGAHAPSRLQMLGRVGYAEPAPHSPRESIAERLLG
ncbi:hypothetical protein [Burkholderia cenocepacia]|uniref:hypothetical protein n=1 Tax=Burkholderia cenocepacia TaxID=95486 RepID=UPI000D0C6D81|nr:hypothetical protein [Burkholderia cenocepacia]SOT45952.1 conserved hypothetical protein [Burkholderia cenocepacia]